MKDFFYFTRGERRGILVLVTGILLVFLFGYFHSYRRGQQPLSEEEMRQQAIAVAEYGDFIAAVQEKQKKREKDFSRYPLKRAIPVSLFPFNPNTADSAAFHRLGLPEWMARNILHYRGKGGRVPQGGRFQKGLRTDRGTVPGSDALYPYRSRRYRPTHTAPCFPHEQ